MTKAGVARYVRSVLGDRLYPRVGVFIWGATFAGLAAWLYVSQANEGVADWSIALLAGVPFFGGAFLMGASVVAHRDGFDRLLGELHEGDEIGLVLAVLVFAIALPVTGLLRAFGVRSQTNDSK